MIIAISEIAFIPESNKYSESKLIVSFFKQSANKDWYTFFLNELYIFSRTNFYGKHALLICTMQNYTPSLKHTSNNSQQYIVMFWYKFVCSCKQQINVTNVNFYNNHVVHRIFFYTRFSVRLLMHTSNHFLPHTYICIRLILYLSVTDRKALFKPFSTIMCFSAQKNCIWTSWQSTCFREFEVEPKT